MPAWLNVYYAVIGVVGLIVPLVLTVFVAVRLRGAGRGLAVTGLVLITASQLVQIVLNRLLNAVDVSFAISVAITNTLSLLVLTVGLVLVAVGLVRLSRGARPPQSYPPRPYPQQSYPPQPYPQQSYLPQPPQQPYPPQPPPGPYRSS